MGVGKEWVISSYWNTESSGQTSSVGGSGKTTAQMKMASTYIGWGHQSAWTINEGVETPRLWWENQAGDLITDPFYYADGTGDPDDPFLIETAQQLNSLGSAMHDWDKHFRLIADIDLGEPTVTHYNTIGINYVYPFTGTFDGNGHTISNFTRNCSGTDYVGFFGCVVGTDTEIRDLGLIDPNMYARNARFIGSLAGYLKNGSITGCYVEGGVVGGGLTYGGGLAGYNNDGSISNCSAEGSVYGYDYLGGLCGYSDYGSISNCYASASVSGYEDLGGLCGINYEGSISSCYAIGDVTGIDFDKGRYGGLCGSNYGGIGNSYAKVSVNTGEDTDSSGGLCGENGGTITNCYSVGSVISEDGRGTLGGLCGTDWRGTIANCFWDIETGGPDNGLGTPLPTAQMQTLSTFVDAGWDFVGETVNGIADIWFILQGDYPGLWWAFVPVLHGEPEVTLGTSNSISWDTVVGGVEYYVECSEDEDFASIVSDSGLIVETSCEFIGLQTGQQYWYRVKARNAAGAETGWSNVESSLQGTLGDAVDVLLDPASLKNRNMKNALLDKIDEAMGMIDAGLYGDALDKLEHDILAKTDGCAETGEPDKNDWIITCEQQSQVYGLVMETIEYVRSLPGLPG